MEINLSKLIYIVLFTIIICYMLSTTAFAQVSATPIEVTGFNEDVIREDGNSEDDYTACVDISNSVFITSDYLTNKEIVSDIAGAFPAGDTVVSKSGFKYHLQQSNQNNTLQIYNSSYRNEGTLTLVTPEKYSAIGILLTGGNGSVVLNAKINYEDETSYEVNSVIAPDWYKGDSPKVVIDGLSREISDEFEARTPSGLDAKLFEYVITNLDSTKKVVSIDFSYNSDDSDEDEDDAKANIFAISGVEQLSYELVFETNGGSTIESKEVAYEGKIERPEDPTREGYEFDDWYSDIELTKKFNFDSGIICDTKIYAKWIKTVTEYNILEGANQTYTINSAKDLVIKADGNINKIVELKMDKKTLNKENYNLENGSTIAILKSNYLDTLSEGLHTLTFVYTDGEVSTSIKIEEPTTEIDDAANTEETTKENNEVANTTNTEVETVKDNPKTGDHIILWICIMLISLLGLSKVITYKNNPK